MSTLKKTLRDNRWACWLALACLVVPMFASYFFDDMFSSLSELFKNPEFLELGWDMADYGFYASGYSFLCIWGGLIVCGALLDKCHNSYLTGLIRICNKEQTVACNQEEAENINIGILGTRHNSYLSSCSKNIYIVHYREHQHKPELKLYTAYGLGGHNVLIQSARYRVQKAGKQHKPYISVVGCPVAILFLSVYKIQARNYKNKTYNTF